METTYLFEFMPDMTMSHPETKEDLLKCELCGDYHLESKTLVIENEFNYCLKCIRRGRLHKEVMNGYPTEAIKPMLKKISNFIFKNIAI